MLTGEDLVRNFVDRLSNLIDSIAGEETFEANYLTPEESEEEDRKSQSVRVKVDMGFELVCLLY